MYVDASFQHVPRTYHACSLPIIYEILMYADASFFVQAWL